MGSLLGYAFFFFLQARGGIRAGRHEWRAKLPLDHDPKPNQNRSDLQPMVFKWTCDEDKLFQNHGSQAV